MKCIFVADDNREFDSEEKCAAYESKKRAEAAERERKLRELEEETKKKQAEQEKRWNEVVEAWKKYEDLSQKYFNDYKVEWRCNNGWLPIPYDDFWKHILL